jgi:cellulose synthase/poly-beta-1,6-N-acetylglucosamine synthase-like glycosyltransferase
VFVDADVSVHRDALSLIESRLAGQPTVAALFGAYDDDPPEKNLVSRYKNLLHHFVHTRGRQEASTFWSGLGAVRKEAFMAVGGFDHRYPRPAIEDVELGFRLRAAGYRIMLYPDIQGAHLKRWDIKSLLRSDIFHRALPWSRLIVTTSQLPADLNLALASRLSAVMAWMVVALFLAGFWVPALWVPGTVLGVLIVALNIPLYRLFHRRGGPVFAVGAMFLHFLYLLYSSAVFGLVWTNSRFRPRSSTAIPLPRADRISR